MKTYMWFLAVVLFVANLNLAYGQITFSTSNHAFEYGMVTLVTGDGREFQGQFVPEKACHFNDVTFPADGRNALVLISYSRAFNGKDYVPQMVAFNLADTSYAGQKLHLMVWGRGSVSMSATPMASDTIDSPGVDRWAFEDDQIRHPRFPNIGAVDYYRKRLKAGDIVWVNDVFVGDSFWLGNDEKLLSQWQDANGYVYPHRFGTRGEAKKLKWGRVIQVSDMLHANGHPYLFVCVPYRDGGIVCNWSYKVIPEQGVVLWNW